MTPQSETVGQRLRRLRKERGLTQFELTSPGVSHAYVSRIEADLRTPSVKAIRKLAAKLGVNPDYLERGLDLDAGEDRELRLLDCELALRFGGDAAEVEKVAAVVAEEAERGGDTATLTQARIALGNLSLARGDEQRALKSFERALASDGISPESDRALFLNSARCYRTTGRPERAEELLRDALERLEREAPDEVVLRARFELELGLALLERGQESEARDLLARADRALEAQGDPAQPIRSLWSRARLDAEAQHHQLALRKLRRAAILLEATEERSELDESRLRLDQALGSQGTSES